MTTDRTVVLTLTGEEARRLEEIVRGAHEAGSWPVLLQKVQEARHEADKRARAANNPPTAMAA